MSQGPVNPYASPPPDNSFQINTSVGHDRAKLREIATAQVFLMQVLLAAIVGGILARVIATYAQGNIVIIAAAVVLQLAISVLQSFAMFRLGKSLYSIGGAIGMAIISFVPCLGLLFMLIANQTATGKLNRAGIKVGFLGADLRQFG
ncbi:hypothetical protein [Anatilimnocola floriformis]|uniref:hypothetical protein n=1 Tax=Anatilimnocola floriformis TaxID=2948575 RepID=UPI0020C4B75D|nr:hypothetical protein [Anatilimnocola floriformis]